ncbi:MAG: winged helix-turn-helix transcriptional regulator [Thaumarchaeota archaeon]|nr:winged helix-turn-helix transcriptional regulator [Nitrososphaerota archaeon]
MAPTPEETVEPQKKPQERADQVFDAFTNRQRLRIYWLLITSSEPLGVREIQRGLGLSSPSVAFHHLDKLVESGLAEKDAHGRYLPVRNVEVSVLQAFAKVGRFVLPRYSFYAAFFTTLTIGYLVLSGSSVNLFTTILGVASAGAFWYEAVRAWRKRPF